MSQGKVVPRNAPMVQIAASDLHSTLVALLEPISATLNALNDTVNALVNAWNAQEAAKNNATETELLAANIHRLSKNSTINKDQMNKSQQSLNVLAEKMTKIEKLIEALVRRQNFIDQKQRIESTPLPEATATPLYAIDQQNKVQIMTRLYTEEDYPDGSWLGDPNTPRAKVRCPISSTDLSFINAKCSSPEKMALTLLDHLFTKDTLSQSNISGKSKLGKKQLDPVLISGIKYHLHFMFSLTEAHWERIKLSIDSKCRTAWKKRKMSPDDEYSEMDLENLDSPDNNYTRGVTEVRDSEIEVLEADQVLHYRDFKNIQILDGDHILPVMSSDGEDGETVSLVHREHVRADDIGTSGADAVSYVLEPIMEVLTEDCSVD